MCTLIDRHVRYTTLFQAVGGVGSWSCNVPPTTTPSVPSETIARWRRPEPLEFLTRPRPRSSSSPVPVTSLSPATHSRVLPWRSTRMPPALVAMLPPMLQEPRSEEHKSELQSLMRISFAGFCLNRKNYNKHTITNHTCDSTMLPSSNHN